LLTGASGFLGSALARHWVRDGLTLHLLLRPSSSRARLEEVRDAVTIHEAAGSDDAMRVVERLRPDVIVHTACAYGRTGETPRQIFDANLALGMALLQGLANTGAPASFVNTGSVLDPNVSLYALSKRQFSDWGAQIAARNSDHLRFVDLRLQHMYGPGDDPSKFTTHVLHACLRHEPSLALTAGEQRRDFLFIDDVVAAYDVVLNALPSLPPHEMIDVGSGNAPRVREFVELAHRLAGSRTRLDFGAMPYRPNEAMLCQADTTRLRALGWHPAFSLESGLRETIRREQLP
jgi:CDP-paratose synthetase